MKNKRIIRYIFPVLVLLTVYLGACTSMDKDFLGNSDNYGELEPLKLEPGYELYDLRVDLKRHTREEEFNGGDEPRTMTLELVYMPIGFYIGNGVFVDTNFNLTVDVLQLYGIKEDEDFTILQNFTNSYVKPRKYIKQGDSFELLVGEDEDGKISVDYSGEEILTDRKPGGEIAIKWEDETLIAEPTGMLKAMETHRISGGEKEYKIKLPLKKVYVTIGKEGLSFGESFDVAIEGKVMKFTYADGKVYRLVRIGEDVYFFNRGYTGLHIAKEGNVITVTRETREQYSYVLER